jgi:predicted RNA methylase
VCATGVSVLAGDEGGEMNIEQHILEIIKQGNSDGNLYYLPDGQVDRKTYMNVNKVLECLGGKWNRKAKAHVFESDISDAIDDVLLTGAVIDKKNEFQFFETPQDIVDQLIELAEIQPGHKCLEPSAGRGNIVESLRQIVGNEKVTCIESNSDNVKILINKGFNVYEGDFLEYGVGYHDYDRIVMNPPFTRQQDITHVEKALLFLKEGGILVSVMSTGITFRQNNKTKAFWDKVKGYEFETVTLPQGAFKVSGTMVNTIILKVVA